MSLVRNEYEECSRRYQFKLNRISEAHPNSTTNNAIEEICWWAINVSDKCECEMSLIQNVMPFFIYLIYSAFSEYISCSEYKGRVEWWFAFNCKYIIILQCTRTAQHTSVKCWYIWQWIHRIISICIFFFLFFLHILYEIKLSLFTVKHTCGKEAAYFTRTILDKISNSLNRVSRKQ